MKKSDIVNAVASAADLTQSNAAKAVDAVFDAITATLKDGDDVRLVGFGAFAVKDRVAAEGRNPRTGEKITIRAARLAKFSPGKGLKDALNS